MRTRLSKSTSRTPNGTSVTRAKRVPRGVQEWECQAALCRALSQLPGYGDAAGPGVTFTFAADFNASRRSPQESVKAKATGIKAGEEDLRISAVGGRILLLELKGPKTAISAVQVDRHKLHRHLGFRVEVLRFKTIEQGVEDGIRIVKEWLAE